MRQTPGSRFSKNAASHLSLDSCIRSSPHAADPENRNEENSPSFPSGRAPPLPKQHEIVRPIPLLPGVRLRLSVVVAGHRCERL